MGPDIEGAIKDGSKDAVTGRYVQGGGTVSAILLQRELGGDQGDAQGPGGVPLLGGGTDHGDGGEAQGRQRVVVPISSGGDGSRGDPLHRSVH